VANKGDISPLFLDVWQIKELRADFSDVWQTKDLGEEESGTGGTGEKPGRGTGGQVKFVVWSFRAECWPAYTKKRSTKFIVCQLLNQYDSNDRRAKYFRERWHGEESDMGEMKVASRRGGRGDMFLGAGCLRLRRGTRKRKLTFGIGMKIVIAAESLISKKFGAGERT
jgi:hypothetical protein